MYEFISKERPSFVKKIDYKQLKDMLIHMYGKKETDTQIKSIAKSWYYIKTGKIRKLTE